MGPDCGTTNLGHKDSSLIHRILSIMIQPRVVNRIVFAAIRLARSIFGTNSIASATRKAKRTNARVQSMFAKWVFLFSKRNTNTATIGANHAARKTFCQPFHYADILTPTYPFFPTLVYSLVNHRSSNVMGWDTFST